MDLSVMYRYNLKEVCRSCMASSSKLRPLNSPMEGDSRTLLEIFTYATNISVRDEDSLPNQICEECVSSICIADSVKRKYQKSQEVLASYLQQTAFQVKIETQENHCYDCDIEFTCDYELSSHKECHQHPYQCSICSVRYAELNTLKFHVSQSHKKRFNVSELNKYECDNCEGTFTGKDKHVFEAHVKQCTHKNHWRSNDPIDAVNKIYASDDGSSDFKEDFDDFDSTESNTVEPKSKIEQFVCTKCKRNFDNKKSLKQHLKEAHLKEQKLSKQKKTLKSVKNNNLKSIPKLGRSKALKSSTSATGKIEKAKIKLEGNDCANDTQFDKLEDDLPPQYSCTMCERKFTKKSSYLTHLKKHEVKANQQYICSTCKREFQHKAHLENHILSIHSSGGNIKCEYCTNSFATPALLEIHVKTHKDNKKHQCQFCDKGFNMLSTLKDHLRVHTGEKPFLCATCGHGFTQKTNLKEHMRRHTGYKPFSCNLCDQRFVSKGELVAHMRKHTGAHPFICVTCNASFTTSSSLVKHRRKHTGERPYLCGYCPMTFAVLGTLKNHQRTHTGEKPYKCMFCEKAFAQKNDLTSHTRCHTGERPYTCSTCGQTFRQTSALKTHLKLHSAKEGADATLRVLKKSRNAGSVASYTQPPSD